MHIVKYIAITLVAVIVVFLILAMTKPDNFVISRTATIAAPAPVIFAQVNNLRNWNAWSPWAKMDPNAKNTFEGPEAGVGSSFAWAGNGQVGEGKMTITESQPSEKVVMRLEFIKPFQGTNTTEFLMKPEGSSTVMTWSMSGKNTFIGKCMSVVMDCDKMIGSQFEQGFANLKALVETKPAS